MISPEEIRAKAQRLYPRLLAAWATSAQAELFPFRLPANLTPIPRDIPATIKAVDNLRSASKAVTSSGYTIHWKEVNSRDFGNNRFPEQLTIDSCEDLLTLAGKHKHFAVTCHVAQQIRAQLPGLNDWVIASIRRLADLADAVDGLLQVTRFFLANPWPDCYARQIPVAVDTKFVERNQAVLAEWLNELLPASAIQADESKFALRFGLRDGQPHVTVRTLDPTLQIELGLPFDEFSVPLRSLRQLAIRSAKVIVVENQLNLLTLPAIPRGIAIRGEGRAVTRLRALSWLAQNAVHYWGDIDVEGFQILSSLRTYVPHARSILMNTRVLQDNAERIVPGSGANANEPPLLDEKEITAFWQCQSNNHRLEQELLLQSYVDAAFALEFGR
jgi:hypothetical protein